MDSPNSLNPRPEGLLVEDRGNVLVLIRRWYAPSVWLTFIFCLVWNAFMVNWYAMALANPAPNNMALWFPVIHVGVGIFLFYSALTGLFNRTIISVGGGKIEVRHGPLPWPGNKSIESSKVQQLFCDEKISRGRGARSSFRVNMVTTDGRKEVLVAAGIQRDEALYIETIAENRLGIQPAPVVGELG